MKPFSESERQEFLAGTHVAVLSVEATDGRRRPPSRSGTTTPPAATSGS
ncbi:pyridoxamine 5'-phosphate oxidase family protein [Mycobacterium avium subsp. avium 2285 (R)]|nr:pyridoxamine 5'-phosphate oxidase family protein [Mycobacterium avium subsp. avium 2285 (R)]